MLVGCKGSIIKKKYSSLTDVLVNILVVDWN